MLKNFKKGIKLILLSNLGFIVLKLLYATIRLKSDSSYKLEKQILDSKEPHIFIFWHNQQLMLPALFIKKHKAYRRKINVLISRHSDGRLIAKIISKLGLTSVAGSSSKGGSQALKGLIKKINNNESVAITPDGPRGPIYKFKPGAIKLAQVSGFALVPITMQASSYWSFHKSWDKMIFPKPFSKLIYSLEKPIYVQSRLNQQEFQKLTEKLEEILSAGAQAA